MVFVLVVLGWCATGFWVLCVFGFVAGRWLCFAVSGYLVYDVGLVAACLWFGFTVCWYFFSGLLCLFWAELVVCGVVL